MAQADDGAAGRGGFLARLRRDAAGATMAMMGFGMIPVTAMIGSGIDVARLYMVQARLQQACDAGVLAGRKAMVSNEMTTEATTIATNYFNVNYSSNAFGSRGIAFTPVATADGQATAQARATVPMTVMKAFGQKDVTLSVRCDAKLELSNSDIMFVLDVTGSMNCAPVDPGCTNNDNEEKPTSRIVALREAVLDFYDTLAEIRDPNARIRYGFTPYASMVNVGSAIMATNSNYIISGAHEFQSREFKQYAAGDTVRTKTSTGSQAACDAWRRGRQQHSYPMIEHIFWNYDYLIIRADYNRQIEIATSWVAAGGGTCTRNIILYRPEFEYKKKSYSIDSYKATLTGGTVATQGHSPGYAPRSSWKGCIEERLTAPNATFTWSPTWTPPNDLDIDAAPGANNDTRWKPAWPDVAYYRVAEGGPNATELSTEDRYASDLCPKAAQQLQTMTRDQVVTYIAPATFRALGSTYHDIGILWGARLLSATGPFSANANVAPTNGKPVKRHIVFMTDGDMAPQPYSYGLYGLERHNRRISGETVQPTEADLKARHNSRFEAICSAAKQKNITIWVVAFAQSMTTQLSGCATDTNYFYAADKPALKAAFGRIAARIAELRLDR